MLKGISLLEREDGVRLWLLFHQNLGKESWILVVPFESKVLLAFGAVFSSSPFNYRLVRNLQFHFISLYIICSHWYFEIISFYFGPFLGFMLNCQMSINIVSTFYFICQFFIYDFQSTSFISFVLSVRFAFFFHVKDSFFLKLILLRAIMFHFL